ncbi:MAG: Yip1 family protein [Gammaproteobacteria bacterium]|nr:Yip1 family protein [Gammaproteobacteria bacterium]MCY4218510.1 Yip1 family protein [Gammaproteobacteria bacterium]MCY4276146.1 Yip1 family protein [Gammaproteobacteria bacterium]
MFKHVFSIFSQPDAVWKSLRTETLSVASLYLQVVIPLSLIPPLAGYYGTTHHGWQVGNNPPVKLTPDSALPISILYFFALLVAFYVIAQLIHWMSSTYGERQPFARCLALAIFSAIPLLISGIAQVYPELWINLLIGLIGMTYAVYLLYRGVPIIMDISDQQGFLFSSAVLAASLVSLVATLAASVILWDFGVGPVFTY